MTDKEQLKTIQNDIKIIDTYIEKCINEEEIEYLNNIKKALKEKQKMTEYQIDVYNVKTSEIIDTFIAEFTTVDELRQFMDNELHNYNEPYYKLSYTFSA